MNPTCFSQIIGNEEIKKQLSCMVSKRAIGHALLFAGPEGIGKSLFAWALAARIMAEYDSSKDHAKKIRSGQHPDVHVFRPEGKLGLHSIQALRQLSEEVYLPPYEASWKFFIIHDADRMLSYSANTLLKTFEEPPPRTVIILLSSSQTALLPTIVSRCATVNFRLLPDELIRGYLNQHYTIDDLSCETIIRQAQGSIGRARSVAEQGNKTRTYLLQLLAQGSFASYRSLQESVHVLSENIEGAKKQVEEATKNEFLRIHMDQISAQQQHAFEKELEGMVAVVLTQEARILFEFILSWYRDLHLLLLGGSKAHLANPDFYPELEQSVQRGELTPLDQVYRYIEESYLALQRSTSLSLCLENLFLKLNRL